MEWKLKMSAKLHENENSEDMIQVVATLQSIGKVIVLNELGEEEENELLLEWEYFRRRVDYEKIVPAALQDVADRKHEYRVGPATIASDGGGGGVMSFVQMHLRVSRKECESQKECGMIEHEKINISIERLEREEQTMSENNAQQNIEGEMQSMNDQTRKVQTTELETKLQKCESEMQTSKQ